MKDTECIDWNTFWKRSGYFGLDWSDVDWDRIDWDTVDEIFSPKRKVKNSFGGMHPHIIGSFHSERNTCNVEYESLGENYAFSLFELDPKGVRYYVQPMEIGVPYRDKNDALKTWKHHPDVLVFRESSCPHLFQIKNSSTETETQSKKQKAIDRACMKYALEQGWAYYRVYPKEISGTVLSNIKFLSGFIKDRKAYADLELDNFNRFLGNEELTIDELSRANANYKSSLELLPYIYHLIAKGVLDIDYYKPVDEMSRVSIATGNNLDVLWNELLSTAKETCGE